MTKNILILSLVFTFFLSGCVPKQETLKDALQTNSANIMKKDYKNIQKVLISFKEKIDKRNPNAYSKNLSKRIYRLIHELNNNFLLKYKNTTLENYKDYLHIAFSKDEINKRNDYLILGLYYLVHYSYEIDKGHRIIALEYDKEKLHNLYKNLQIIKWKIKVDKDVHGNYLFLTWQNNWQIELEKRLKNKEEISLNTFLDLNHIKNKQETFLDHSNFSFEVQLTQMIDSVKNSLEALCEEPTDLSVMALKSVFMFL
ncbi:MAG: hypothetical protein C0625_04245 [Arcobacter sp.]|nr:MAG: hypothetical protein C0625_04245 [Arcobacter sp.]